MLKVLSINDVAVLDGEGRQRFCEDRGAGSKIVLNYVTSFKLN